jgi:hypothetical protein
MNSFLVLLAIFFRFCQQQETTDTVNPVSKADYFEPGKEYAYMVPDILGTLE